MAPSWHLHLDLRAPSFATPASELYAAALDMASWADDHGVAAVVLSEHHGSADGYLPAALTMAAAVAARTRRCIVSINALPLTLLDPVAVAEQVAVVNLVARGRLALTVVAGYVTSELAMFGIESRRRWSVLDEKLDVLTRCLAGERFEWQGREVHVTPSAPVVAPPMLFVGGSSPGAARRAARVGAGFSPTHGDPALGEAYAAECRRLGRPPGIVVLPQLPLFVHLSHDPARAWEALRPHAAHELASYREWSAGDAGSPYAAFADADSARAGGLWQIVTPAVAVDLARTAGYLVFKPLVGGLDPALGWESLRLLADEVLPVLSAGRPTPGSRPPASG